MPTATTFFDCVGHKDENGDRHYVDGKGSKVELTDAEYERLSALGAVGGENDPVPVAPQSPFNISGEPLNLSAEAERQGQVLMSREDYERLTGGDQTASALTDGLSEEELAVYNSGKADELKTVAEGLGIVVETGDKKKDLAQKLVAAGYSPSTG